MSKLNERITKKQANMLAVFAHKEMKNLYTIFCKMGAKKRNIKYMYGNSTLDEIQDYFVFLNMLVDGRFYEAHQKYYGVHEWWAQMPDKVYDTLYDAFYDRD